MTATAPTQQPTTPAPQPITLPALSLAAYQRLTEALVYDLQSVPGSEPRIRRGAGDLTSRRILATAEVGVYLVQASDGASYYRTTTFSCSCKDAQGRGVRCRHSMALVLYTAACDEARWARLTATYELTPRALAVTQPHGAA